jgi:hypothetical protein
MLQVTVLRHFCLDKDFCSHPMVEIDGSPSPRLALQPPPAGYGTRIFLAILRYLRLNIPGLMQIVMRWVPYLKSKVADPSSKAIQFFVNKCNFTLNTKKTSLHYLTLDLNTEHLPFTSGVKK